jgi:lipoprotein signal peptidase
VNRSRPWSGPLDRLAAIASVVFVIDFATKQWALCRFAPDDGSLVSGWHLTLVNNTHLGWGLGSSASALPLTLVLTIAIAALVIRICGPLSAVDPNASTTLGLLVGSGAANLADALIPPHGVVDFIAYTAADGVTTSFNVADVVLAAGLILSLRSMWRIVLAMRGRPYAPQRPLTSFRTEATFMRDRVLVSAGHALLAMCGFIWLYSMALAWTSDQGRSAPNSLLCGVGVFAVAFAISRALSRLRAHRAPAPAASRTLERVVLDGSIPAFARGDERVTPRVEETPQTLRRDRRKEPRQNEPPVA